MVSAFKNCINLEWTPPENDGGTKLLGYQLEKCKKGTNQWVALNSVNEPIKGISILNQIKKSTSSICTLQRTQCNFSIFTHALPLVVFEISKNESACIKTSSLSSLRPEVCGEGGV